MKKKRRITSLKDVKTLEVSLVEAGANLKRRFPITKSKGHEMNQVLIDVLKADGQSEAVTKLEGLLKEEMPAEAREAIVSAMKLLEAYSDMTPVSDALDALRAAAVEEGVEEAEEVEEEKAAELVSEQKAEEDLKKSLDTLPTAARAAIDAIWKAKEELTAKSEKLEKDLGEEIAKRSRREYLAKAEKTLCNIPGHSLEEVVDLMIAIRATDADLGTKVEKALEASSAALQGGPLLVEAGRNVPDMDTQDPWAAIQKMARQEVETSGGTLTMPAAIAKTIQTNPKLYAEYNSDRSKGGK